MKSFEKLAIAIGVVIVIAAIVVVRVALPKRPAGVTTPPSATVETEPEKVKAKGPRLATAPRTPTAPPRTPVAPGVTPQVEKAKREGVVLAKVNGVPITEYDVFGPAGLQGFEGAGPGLETSHLKSMLDQAIEQELLHQYAVKMGLDQSADYKRAKEQQDHWGKRMEIDSLAGYYEQQNPALKALRDSLQASDAEVEQYYQENKERYAKLGEERAKRSIQSMLSAQKYNQAYKEWLASEMTGVPVLVNGQAVPQNALQAGLDAMFPAMYTPGGPPPAPPTSNALEDFVRAATGATDASDAARQKLIEAEIQIGSTTVKVGELFAMPMMGPAMGGEAVGPPVDQMLKGPMLIATVKSYILAEKARQAGLESSDEYKQRYAMPTPMGPGLSSEVMSKQLLSNLVWQQKGLASPDSVQVSDQEIQQHIDANPARYKRILAREGGEERAKVIAQRRIAYEKLREQKEEFLKELRASATIEILDERFK